MHFEYYKKSSEILQKAKKANYFPLGTFSDESILARYYLSLYFKSTYGFIPRVEKDEKMIPIPIIGNTGRSIYWSISHTENYIAFIVSDTPCGIDIAEFVERDDSLLDLHHLSEYEILSGKNWKNFYILWTAKEAIIKLANLSLDDIGKIQLEDTIDTGLLFVFSSQRYKIHTDFQNNLFISYAHSYGSI